MSPKPMSSIRVCVAFLLSLLLAGTSLVRAEAVRKKFHVRDFGAVADGRAECGESIRAAIQAAIQAGGPAEVVLGPGLYRATPATPRGACFPIQNATNLVIRGAGPSTGILVADPAATAFSVGPGQDVRLHGFKIDYDPLPFCQGTIRAVDPSSGSFDLEIDPGYPTPDGENFLKAVEPYGKWGMIMDRTVRRIRSGTPDHYMTPRWEPCGGRTWRFFTLDEHHRGNLRYMRVGDAYVHLARGHGTAVFAQGCSGIRIEKVIVHSSPGLAVGLVGNRGEIVVQGLEVRFPSHALGRLLTANADGVHCQQNRSGPLIEKCYFEGMADDAINLYTPPNVLREVRSPTQWLVSPGATIFPGDRLQVLDPLTGRIRGEVKTAVVTPENRWLLLTLEKPLEGVMPGADHRTADTLYNLDACGAGFQIRHNYMKGNRRYGCLLRAGNGVVENNTFEDTTGAGVVLTNEPDWPEGPVPWDIVIRGNCFLRGGTCLGYSDSPNGAALAVQATRLGHQPSQFEAIRKVLVEGNRFKDRAGAVVWISGGRDITLRNNHIQAEPGTELRRKGAVIRVENSSSVTLQKNKVRDQRPGTTAAIEIGTGVASGEPGMRISGLDVRLNPEARPVVDRRE